MTSDSNQDWETIDCPVCDGTEFNELFRKKNEPFVQCLRCKLVLINPRPIFSQVVNTYSDGYSQNYTKKHDKKIQRSAKRVRLLARRLREKRSWLDIGCSAGFVVKAAEAAGFEAWGVDVEKWGIEYGKRELNLGRLFHGQLEDQSFPANHFQVISLYDVIEHVPDLNSTLAHMKRLLSEDGLIDIITPDIGHWRVTKPLQDWKEIKPSEHLYYFNAETLDRLLARHDLKIIKKRLSLKSTMKIVATHS